MMHGAGCTSLMYFTCLLYTSKRIYILAPLVRNRKGHYKELFEQIRKKGYLYVLSLIHI